MTIKLSSTIFIGLITTWFNTRRNSFIFDAIRFIHFFIYRLYNIINKMESREIFLKGEIEMLKKILDVSYDYCPYSSALGDEKRLKKTIKLLLEIKEMVITLKRLIKGSI